MIRRGLLALALSLGLSAPALAKPPVWIVRDANSTLTLFGSVHILPQGLDWRPKALDDAIREADDLWFEIPIDGAAQSEVNSALQARGYLPSGQTLNSLLPAKTAAKLAARAKNLNIPQEALQRMKPWLADATLGVAALSREQAGAEDGVERAVAASVPSSVRRAAFETGAQQVAMFDALPMRDQIASLEDTLNQLDRDPGAYARLLAAWMKGDEAAMRKLGPDDVKRVSPALYRMLILDRNEAWLVRLKARLAGSGNTVVVVGAGHMLGPDGLPARLRAMGYKVELSKARD